MGTLDELQAQLEAFFRAQSGDPAATISDLATMPGHAGFSYGFTARYRQNGAETVERLVLRLPPPNVRYVGTADVMRQVRILNALRGTTVPVPEVRYAGEDPQWFGRPYFMTVWLDGYTLHTAPGEWSAHLSAADLHAMAEQAMQALAALHRLDWQQSVPELGPPLDPLEDVQRWDRFWERAADPELVRLGPEVKRRLLERMPPVPRIGVFHGDYQFSNLLWQGTRLVAVLDWELVGIGSVLNDLGWIMLFVDNNSWAHPRVTIPLPPPAEFARLYAEAWGGDPGDVAWYRALAGYKFGIISGFNLMLHRRGKRPDPHWEELVPSIPRLFERALEVLDGME